MLANVSHQLKELFHFIHRKENVGAGHHFDFTSKNVRFFGNMNKLLDMNVVFVKF
jgi:hypothetical protein